MSDPMGNAYQVGKREKGDPMFDEPMYNIEEPAPVKNDKIAVWNLVISDMYNRDEMGTKKYGTHLQPFNGRDALKDAYQESLDLVVYLRQVLFERDGK